MCACVGQCAYVAQGEGGKEMGAYGANSATSEAICRA
jgi:hypothetical protein